MRIGLWCRRIWNLGDGLRRGLLGRLFAGTLAARRPALVVAAEGPGRGATRALALRDGRVIRLASSAPLRLDVSYADWLETLKQTGLTAPKLTGLAASAAAVSTIESLAGEVDDGPALDSIGIDDESTGGAASGGKSVGGAVGGGEVVASAAAQFFPLSVYLESFAGSHAAAEWVHYCRASRQPTLAFLSALTGQDLSPPPASPPASPPDSPPEGATHALVIHSFTAAPRGG